MAWRKLGSGWGAIIRRPSLAWGGAAAAVLAVAGAVVAAEQPGPGGRRRVR